MKFLNQGVNRLQAVGESVQVLFPKEHISHVLAPQSYPLVSLSQT